MASAGAAATASIRRGSRRHRYEQRRGDDVIATGHMVRQQPLRLVGGLVDDWAHLAIEDRRRLVGEVFAEVRVDAQGVRDFMPRDEWKPYMAAVVPATARVTAERKTGLEPAVGALVTLSVCDRGLDLRRRAA